MTAREFNEKWKDYLEERHYGLAIDTPEVVEYLDTVFEDLTKLPGFQYSQIKWKFSTVCFYANGVSSALKRSIERNIEDIHSFDLIEYLHKQKRFSERVFGPTYKVDRTEGILKHIEEEIEEVRENPKDLEEWIDITILALDGCWRTGATSKEIAEALEDKLQKNVQRKWPDWRNANPEEPINHET